MTIDEAISHCLEVAEEQSRLYSLCPCPCDGTDNCMSLKNGKDMGCTKCAADHRQLAEWLTELKKVREENKVLTSECDRLIKGKGELLKKSERIAEYKRLLKAAVEDFRRATQGCIGIQCDSCPHTSTHKGYVWRYADEALALIGKKGENDA